MHQSGHFARLQTGNLSSETFLNDLRAYIPSEVSDESLKAAWNAMILDFPAERLKTIHALKKQYRTFLLSNTNYLHWEYYYPEMKAQVRQLGLPGLFEKEYYSHEIGLAKPDQAIYRYVLDENALVPEETLFLDDKDENLEAAREMGIQVRKVNEKFTLVDFFQEITV